VSIVCLVGGLGVLALGVFGAYGFLQLEVSHGTTGLYVGQLDEQHPWLYKTMALTRNAAAEAYRQGILADRGRLRGVDFVIMQEIVRAHEALQQTHSARSVAERLQQQAPSVDATATKLAATPGKQEPQLVRFAAR
jgi:hypothetical protein